MALATAAPTVWVPLLIFKLNVGMMNILVIRY